MNVLFVCSRNRLRSPTAERIFADHPDIETDSAGLAADAGLQLSGDQVAWADLVVVMERQHATKLKRNFSGQLGGTNVVCLDIPDRYTYMQPELVALLHKKMAKFL